MSRSRSRFLATHLVAFLSVAGPAPLSAGPPAVDSLVSTEEIEIRGGGKAFGYRLAVSGDVAIVGSPSSDVGGNLAQGEAHVFRFDGSDWLPEQTLIASNGAATRAFGLAVAVDGDVAVVGSQPILGAIGEAHVFRHAGGVWTEEAILTASDGTAHDEFGLAVAIAGDRVFVGAPNARVGGFFRGKVYAYAFDGTSWGSEQLLVASDGGSGDDFGVALGASGDVLLVGAPSHDGVGHASPERGAVYEFRWLGGSWSEVRTLLGSDSGTGGRLGEAVALSGDLAVLGSPSAALGSNTRQGAAYALRFDGSSWVEEAKLTASHGGVGDLFGSAVAVLGDLVAATTVETTAKAGVAQLFRYDGASWNDELHLEPTDEAFQDFGRTVGLATSGLLVGAPYDRDLGAAPDQGSVYHFPLRIVDLAAATHAIYVLEPDGTGGSRIARAPFVGSANVSAVPIAPFSQLPASAFGGIDYDACAKTLYWLAPDAAGGSELRSAPFDGGSIGPDALVTPLSTTPPSGYGGLSWLRRPGELRLLAPSGRFETVLVYRPFDGTTLGAVAGGGSWDPARPASAFGGLAHVANEPVPHEELYALAPTGPLLPGTRLLGGWQGARVLGLWSPLDPADFGGFSITYDLPCSYESAAALPADRAPNDGIGSSVAVSSGVAVVGSPRDDDGWNESGSAYVYRFDGATWVEEQKLGASDARPTDLFGRAVSISGDVLLVGANGFKGSSTRSGSAYAFRYDGSSWVEEEVLVPSDGASGDQFGQAVSVAGNLALVGAVGDDDRGSGSGSAYLYRFAGTGWLEEQKLVGSSSWIDDRFGDAVSVSNGVAAIGAPRDDDRGLDSGSVYVYRFDGTSWIEEQHLLASDGSAGDRFGTSVSISGDVLAVGASLDDDRGANAGAAYVYRFDGIRWLEERKLTPLDGSADDLFGASVSASDAAILVGAPLADDEIGAAYVFRYESPSWVQDRKLRAADGAFFDSVGAVVSMDRVDALVGAPGDYDSGSARFFTLGSCGNGSLDAGEACDDGSRAPGDGCSPACEIEACANGLDDDGDGLVDAAGGDPGCWGSADSSEQSGFLPCDNGIDDDGDGQVDLAGGDAACQQPGSPSEAPQCNDGVDNDGDGAIDFDGGLAAGLPGGGAPDPECAWTGEPAAWWHLEATPPAGATCGLGPEVLAALALLGGARRVRRRRS